MPRPSIAAWSTCFLFAATLTGFPTTESPVHESAYDTGQQDITALSFDEAVAFLASDRIYEDIVKNSANTSEKPYNTGSYSLENQFAMIEKAAVTPKQREQLWAICLRRNLNTVSVENGFLIKAKDFKIRSIAADVKLPSINPLLRTLAPYGDLVSFIPLVLFLVYFLRYPPAIMVQLNATSEEKDRLFISATAKIACLVLITCIASYKFISKPLLDIEHAFIHNNRAQARTIRLFNAARQQTSFPQELASAFLLFEATTPFATKKVVKEYLEQLKNNLPQKDSNEICYTLEWLIESIETLAQLPPDNYETRILSLPQTDQ
jgi:hypothetical protein